MQSPVVFNQLQKKKDVGMYVCIFVRDFYLSLWTVFIFLILFFLSEEFLLYREMI